MTNDVVIFNRRKNIEEIREKIRLMITKSKIIVPLLSSIEVSHHYGIDKFYKFGLSMITIFNKNYCKKLLFMMNKQIHPKQYHKEKDETFFVLYGAIKLKTWNKNKKIEKILRAGDLFTIKPNHIHWFQGISISGAIIEELSTESKKADSFYLDDKITKNKNRKSFISLN